MKRITLLILLSALLVLAGGCENETGTLEPTGSTLVYAPDKTGFATVTPEILDSLEYEVFEGISYPGFGGWLQTSMQTWPGGSSFSIMVPPGALPGEPDEPVTWFMKIPTQDAYNDYFDEHQENLPLIIRLGPHSVNFLEPVTVAGTWMPWIDIDPTDINAWTIAPEVEDFGPATFTWVKKMWKVTFQAPHFSDWGVADGVPDD